MLSRRRLLIVAAATANFLSPAHAQTKRQPNATERTRVEHALQQPWFHRMGQDRT